MNPNHFLSKAFRTLSLLLALGISLTACAKGDTNWKEQVLLHDGSKIVVERSQSYGGRHEVGQSSPIKEQEITFTLPKTGKTVTFKSEYSEDIGRANFQLLALHILNDTPYIVAMPNLCLSFNKWGRPNPPYVFFKHDGKAWQRITLAEFPKEFQNINLVIDTKDEERNLVTQQVVSAEGVKQINSSLLRYPNEHAEFKTILREALPKERINQMCMEMVPYKGSWVMPNDPIARKFIDSQKNRTGQSN